MIKAVLLLGLGLLLIIAGRFGIERRTTTFVNLEESTNSGDVGFAFYRDYYLGEHRKGVTKLFHIVGTLLGVVLVVLAFVLKNYWLIPIGIVAAYGLAWFSHFVFEHNRPATFKHPLLSFRSDFRMMRDVATGREKLDADD